MNTRKMWIGTLTALGLVASQGVLLASGPGSVKVDDDGLSQFPETIGSATVRVERSHGEDGAISVSYSTVGISATAGSDFTAVSGTLSWADGDESDRTVAVPIADDGEAEGNETFRFVLSNPTGGATLEPGRGERTFTILSSAGGGGGGGCEPGDDCGGDDGGGGGTCEPGDDCGGGDGGGGGTCEPGDDCGGGDGGGDDGGGDDGGGDDGGDAGVIKFDERTFLGLESAGVAVIAIERSHGEDGAVTIVFSTENGTASAGSDYTPVTRTLSWANGDGSTKVVQIPLVADGVTEGNETVRLVLSNPTGGVGIDSERGTAVLTILESGGVPPGDDDDDDNDRRGVFKFSEGGFQVIEGQPMATVFVERSHGESGAVSVDYSASAGSATAGDDFDAVSGTLSWASGDGSTRSFQVPIVDDGLAEDSETIDLELSNATNGATIDAARGSALLTVVDNDASQAACVPGPGTLCLLGGRFRASIDFRTPNVGAGTGHAMRLSDQTGLFWFFNQSNMELLVKVIDGCGVQGLRGHWIFFAATTNVDFSMTITDTETGVSKQYRNPLGLAALPVQDVTTFRACP